jgi:hypothetical protein
MILSTVLRLYIDDALTTNPERKALTLTRDEFLALPSRTDYQIGTDVLVWIGRGGKTAVPARIEHISQGAEGPEYHLDYADTDGFSGQPVRSQTVKTARLIRPLPTHEA